MEIEVFQLCTDSDTTIGPAGRLPMAPLVAEEEVELVDITATRKTAREGSGEAARSGIGEPRARSEVAQRWAGMCVQRRSRAGASSGGWPQRHGVGSAGEKLG